MDIGTRTFPFGGAGTRQRTSFAKVRYRETACRRTSPREVPRSEEVGELLDDLEHATGHDIETPYFLGSIVPIKDPEGSDAQVVDGQQRLTTLTILLCIMRELAEGKEAAQFDPFILEEANPLSGAKARYRLSLREILSGMDGAKRARLASFIVKRCFLVVVSASDEASACP